MQETQETQLWSQGQEDPLEEEMAPHSNRGAQQAIVHGLTKESDMPDTI